MVSEVLSDKEWEKLFDLINRVVADMEGSVGDKREIILAKAAQNHADNDLEEFASWFQD